MMSRTARRAVAFSRRALKTIICRLFCDTITSSRRTHARDLLLHGGKLQNGARALLPFATAAHSQVPNNVMRSAALFFAVGLRIETTIERDRQQITMTAEGP